MRIRRKTVYCLNCGLTLDEIYNYCPRCGQENNDKMVSFGQLVRDFFINYFSLDTKFFRSIRPFLLQPGRLTRLYIEGKRASFVNPMRLYIIVSVIFFFLSTWWVKQSMRVVGDATQREMTLGIGEAMSEADQPPNAYDPQFIKERSNAASEADVDSSRTVGKGIKQITDILADESLGDDQALDSLQQIGGFQMNLDKGINRLAFSQLRKVARQDMEIFMAYVMQNMPVMMLLILPVYALLLKLLYIRSNILYVKHLVHGVHLHAFTFFLLSILLSVHLLFAPSETFYHWMQLLVFLLLLIYVYVSMFNVYQQGWLKTLLKFSILGLVYFFILLVAGLSEALISFLIF